MITNFIYKNTSFALSHPEATCFKKIKCRSASGEEKQKEILDSIRYAKRIQMAQIPSEKQVAKSLERLRKI